MRRLTLIVAGLLLLACCRCSRAEVCRVVATATQCTGNRCQIVDKYGTAFSVARLPDNHYLFITAGHVVENARSVKVWLYGKAATAHVMSHSLRPDVAFLSVPWPADLSLYCVSEDPPREGAAVRTVGFPGSGSNYRQRDVAVLSASPLRIAGASITGESGGPVWDRSGNVAGLVFATDERQTHCTSAAEIIGEYQRRFGVSLACRGRDESPHATAPLPPLGDSAGVDRTPAPAVPATPPASLGDPAPSWVPQRPDCRCDGQFAALRDQLGRSQTEINRLTAELDALRKLPVKVQLKQNGKLIDEDTYQVHDGQPIVLDFRTKQAGSR